MKADKNTISQLLVLTLSACALSLAILAISKELGLSPLGARAHSIQAPIYVNEWRGLIEDGHRIGHSNAPVQIVVFSDFECGACADFARRVFPLLRQEFPDKLALIFRHWPISRHKNAYPAARAVECAARQGYFQALHDTLFAQQSLLGWKSYAEMARDSGVPDIRAFTLCMDETDPVPTIEDDVKAARSLGATGTPTIVINGWLFRGGYDLASVRSTIQSILDDFNEQTSER